VSEEVIVLANDGGTCYVETKDNATKIIEGCLFDSGDVVVITYGKGLAWATVVSP